MSDIASFRQTVESFIAARGWTPTRFGRTVAGDPLFVFDLREGREPRSDTRARILKAMGVRAELSECAMRLSVGWTTAKADIDACLEGLNEVLLRHRERRASAA